MRYVPLISLLVIVVVAIGWQIALNRSYHRGREIAGGGRAIFPVVPVPPEASVANSAEKAEKRLGPFLLAGKNYTVVLRQRTRVPGSTGETGITVAAMEIRDPDEVVLYKRSFSVQSEKDAFSDAWHVSAHLMSRSGGTGLMLNYSVDAEPSAPSPEETTWWQLFGVVNGRLRPFTGPLAVEGDLLDTHLDTFDFRVWAHHSSVIFPVHVDWAHGKLLPEQNCESTPCEFKVIPKEPGYRDDLTFVRLCASPEKCENPERVIVRKDSNIEVLSGRVPVQWKQGSISSEETDNNELAGQGEINVPEGNVWLKMRIDGKEGWLHDEEDYMSLGMIFEQ